MKPYVDFSDKLRRSLAFFEVKHALKLDEAAKNDPNLRLTLLLTCSDNWNTTQKIDQTVSAGQGANVTVVLRPASRSRKNGKE